MNIKSLSKQTLLAALLCGGVSAAWAEGEVAFTTGNVIGATDNSDGWYGGKSEIFEIQANKTLTLEFTSYTATDEQLQNLDDKAWHAWYTHVLNFWKGEGDNLFMRADGYGWSGSLNTNINSTNWFTYNANNYPTDFRAAIDGAKVVMTIERVGLELRIKQDITTTTNAVYHHYFVGTYGTTAENSIWCQLTVERAHVVVTKDKAFSDTQMGVTGTLLGVENNSGGFGAGVREDFIIAPNESLTLHFKNYTNKINNWNNWAFEMQQDTQYCDWVMGGGTWGDLNVAGSFDGSTWPSSYDVMDGADVMMTIVRNKANVTVTADHTPLSGDPFTVKYSVKPTKEGFADADITVRLLTEGAHLDLLPVAASISSYGWATFSSDYALDFSKASEGLTAYMITGHEGNAVTKSEVTGTVPAGTGLLLKGAEGSYTVPVIGSSTTDVSDNKLIAGTGASVAAEDGKTKYVLGVNNNGTATDTSDDYAEFQKIVSTAATVAKGKAYLQFDEVISAPTLFFDTNATPHSDQGSENATPHSDQGSENGMSTGVENLEFRELELRDKSYFNLAGQRVAQPTQGLYIVNGKKVVIK